MSDRELLEAAARAAGMVIGFEASQCFYSEHGTYGAGMYCLNERGDISSRWNPLTDDGDALRLAALLEIDIEFHVNVEAIAWGRWEDGEQRHVFQEPGLSTSATRRAITRAAAAIGAKDE